MHASTYLVVNQPLDAHAEWVKRCITIKSVLFGGRTEDWRSSTGCRGLADMSLRELLQRFIVSQGRKPTFLQSAICARHDSGLVRQDWKAPMENKQLNCSPWEKRREEIECVPLLSVRSSNDEHVSLADWNFLHEASGFCDSLRHLFLL